MAQGNITDSSIDYVLTYWHKPNSSAEWQLVEENLTYTQLISKVIAGTGWIDEVRVHPVDALMTTITYEPLVGKTSETDANHRTIYYEYDDQHRLKYTKDEKRNRSWSKMYDISSITIVIFTINTYFHSSLMVFHFFRKTTSFSNSSSIS
ncbi:MAG: hypothetical protein ACOVQA_06835, partial [Thermoflexibacteraceae bacterium]|jgi:YD repeat-containing protein